MAEQKFRVNCGFFNSVNGDRRYTAEEMNRPYRRVVTNGVFATPAGTASTDLQVISAGSGMTITVKTGEGIFANKWFENPSDFNLTVTSNTSGLPRRDSIIVQVDNRNGERTGNIVYREGIPAANPQPPDIGTVDNVIEYRVANIYVASGATAINQDAIVDLRGSSECPWVTSLINQVDTSTLWMQYRDAFHDLYSVFKGQSLPFITGVHQLDNNHVVTNDNSAQIPIGISQYDRSLDILIVTVNGFVLTEDVEYTIDSNSSITLVNPVDAGTAVWFRVLKSSSNDSETESSILTLNDGFELANPDEPLMAYKYGQVVVLTGSIKRTSIGSAVIASLPNRFQPMKHIYTALSVSNNLLVQAEITKLGAFLLRYTGYNLTEDDTIHINVTFIAI